MLKRLHCGNPDCGELFVQKEKHQKYCCSKCSAAARQELAAKRKSRIFNDEIKIPYIILRNGVEIRNDAMGKEISGQLLVFSK